MLNGNLKTLSILTILLNISSHIALIARKLLHLAVCICNSIHHLTIARFTYRLTESLQKFMTKYVNLAPNLVTTNENLIDSLEGMECLIFKGVYLINSGNLHRAWMCFRRAMILAQLTGLHKGTPKSLKILDHNTKASCLII